MGGLVYIGAIVAVPNLEHYRGWRALGFEEKITWVAWVPGRPNPCGMVVPLVYLVQLAACPTVTVTLFCAVPPVPWHVSTYVVDWLGIYRSVPPPGVLAPAPPPAGRAARCVLYAPK
jgi:hypothetical protein